MTAHPAAVALNGRSQAAFACCARRPDGREDAAAACVQLLVARPACAERELLDAIAAERGVGVTVDEARDRTEPAAVELDDLSLQGGQLPHPTHRLDRLAAAQHVRVLERLDLPECRAAQRRLTAGGSRELREIADEEPLRHASRGADGIFSPPCSAASSASS